MNETIDRVVAFVRYAWFVVAYLIVVILWGAVVRATGSGAGCGNHWPVCNGEIIPRADNIETLIEFSHRLTSGVSGIFIIILLIWAFRLKPVRQFVRRMALMTFVFVIIEGFLGMLLVRLELVEDNASSLRAFVVALHLLNTLVLVGWSALTAWGASQTQPIKLVASTTARWLVGIGLLGFALMSAAGAVTALGDTLIQHGVIGEATSDIEHFLVSLRVLHPLLAVAVSAYLFVMGYMFLHRYASSRINMQIYSLFMLVSLQVGFGILNIVLKAPVWMQVVHLLVADILWILLVVLSANLLTTPQES
jgi:heme A synthase